MDKNIKIKLWGVRGSTPCANPENMRYGGNTTCIQIIVPGKKELIIADCGTGFRNLGNELESENNQIKGLVFITHPHWDHLQGFPFFKPFYNPNNSFDVYMPPQHDAGCKEILQGHLSNTFFPVSIDMLEAELNCYTFDNTPVNFNHSSVEYMWANHTVPTAIYKFKIGDKVIVFAPDNELPIDNDPESIAFIESFKSYVEGADVLIHDAQFTYEEHKNRMGWGHSDWETLLEITKDLNIKKLCLTHHDPDHTDDQLDKINSRIKNMSSDCFKDVSLVQEGQEIYLSI